ncbi:MAG: hypothetical protein E6K70_00475 [Planctomycetota bacterium]|nr:MAG: hypothetical protein E6K70_00475 [Planctomycetota bacterium]
MFPRRLTIGIEGLLVTSVILVTGCSEGQKPSPLERTDASRVKPANRKEAAPQKGRLGEKKDENK